MPILKENNMAVNQPLTLDQDPMVKVAALIPILKESVRNVVRHAVYILHNTSPDATRKNELPSQIQGFFKIVEDFHNICDQVQIWLKLALASADLTKLATQFSPEVVGGISAPQDPNQKIISYSDFLLTAKKQIASAKRLELLLTKHTDQMSKVFGNFNSQSIG
ncbi:uncharacterized protein LOC135685079 [Rhopilema esculentum]|uniref:uncharacterized protein LOC135685079 n=1 Tax=Rhopilema esculentum TaxID=499914 RepID=UPI0031D5AC33